MAIRIKTEADIEILREGGRRHAQILNHLATLIKPGITTEELNDIAEKMIKEKGDIPAFLGYQPSGIKNPYPASLCVSINDEVVHGIPSKDRYIHEGDIVSIDLGLSHRGLITDSAITVFVGTSSKEVQDLINITQKALQKGIESAVVGNTTGDIGCAIETYVLKNGPYGIVTALAGHGVGYSVHEDPFISNVGKPGKGEELVQGMVIAIEPMITLGSSDVYSLPDEYTYKTKDGSLSAHFEHTIVITKNGTEILTKE